MLFIYRSIWKCLNMYLSMKPSIIDFIVGKYKKSTQVYVHTMKNIYFTTLKWCSRRYPKTRLNYLI